MTDLEINLILAFAFGLMIGYFIGFITSAVMKGDC
jgi:hypothetical protein